MLKISQALVFVLLVSGNAIAADTVPLQGLASGGGMAVMKCVQPGAAVAETITTVVYVSVQDVRQFYQNPVPPVVQTTGVMTVTPSNPQNGVAAVYNIALTVTSDTSAQTVAYDVVNYGATGQKLQELTTTFSTLNPNVDIPAQFKLFDSSGNVSQQESPACDTTPLNGALL